MLNIHNENNHVNWIKCTTYVFEVMLLNFLLFLLYCLTWILFWKDVIICQDELSIQAIS